MSAFARDAFRRLLTGDLYFDCVGMGLEGVKAFGSPSAPHEPDGPELEARHRPPPAEAAGSSE